MVIIKYFFFDCFILSINLSQVIIDFFIAAAIAFILIIIVTSYLRFQDIINSLKESNSSDNDIKVENLIRIELADKISKNLRKKNLFSVVHIKLNIDDKDFNLNSRFINFLAKNFRETDSFFKHNDSELISIMECDDEFVNILVARCINLIVEYFDNFSIKDIYIGVCSFPKNGVTGEELLNSAEEALSKASQGNRIIYAQNKDDEEVYNEEQKNFDKNKNENSQDKKIIDPLTKVLNDKAISKFLQREISELRLKKEPCVVFSVKINNIFNIVDYFGDKIMDDVVRSVSRIIQDSLRDFDIIGTYKYGEFLILAHCELDKFSKIGHRLIGSINTKKYDFKNQNINLSVSLGAAAYPEHGNNIYDLYKKTQKVLVYCNDNDISGYMIYDTKKHGA